MAKKKNVFTHDLESSLRHLSDLFHASSTGSWIVTQAVKLGRTKLGEARASGKRAYPNGVFGLDTKMPIPDYAKEGRFLTYHAYDPRGSQDEGLLTLAEEMERRLQGQMLCAAFEDAERYLKSTAAHCFFQLRTGGGDRRPALPFHKNEFHRRHSKWRQEKYRGQAGTLPYFRDYVGFHYRDGMLAFLDELLEGLPLSKESSEYEWGLAKSWTDYRPIEFARHRLVHAFGTYETESANRLGKVAQQRIREMTSTSILTGQRTLLPTQKEVSRNIERLAGMVLHVHRGLSDAFSMQAAR
ncbi:MAG: hypothetical protein H0T47_02830 [Planctomycetaceae bacterium]|nr:hypothetical protein [Planctomycetaceae bacterium]